MSRPPKVNLVCAECGAAFFRKPSQVKKDKDYYCGLDCAGKAYKKIHAGSNSVHFNSIQVPCSHCGAILSRKESLVRKRKNHFCNKTCWGKWKTANTSGENSPHYKKVSITCLNCESEFLSDPARVNERGNFCSSKCYGFWRSKTLVASANPLWKGGPILYYGPNWYSQRRAARQRDNYTCQECGKTEIELSKELDVHHIKPLRDFGYIEGENENYLQANDLSNLVCLCHVCHMLIELHQKRSPDQTR